VQSLTVLQVYIGKLGNAYMYDCEIAGQTDFFYGFGTCWVTNSAVTLRGCGGGITAWKGTNTTFENKYGVYIHDSDVRKANSSLAITHKCYLGRPWNALHRSIFSHSYLDDSINPAGYVQWSTNDPRINQSKSRDLMIVLRLLLTCCFY
jgi:pectin methylesterase-like acyl-CoA thioesterase